VLRTPHWFCAVHFRLDGSAAHGPLIRVPLCNFVDFSVRTTLTSNTSSYNVGILSSVLVHPGFVNALSNPSAAQKGVITAIYYLGTWLSYIFLSQPASDKLGRRYAALVGIVVTCVGTALQAGATGDANGACAMVVIGRIIAGMGVALVSTSVPLYQSEVAPARHRGRFVVMNHIGMVAGLAVGFW
jgi:MFS family permease